MWQQFTSGYALNETRGRMTTDNDPPEDNSEKAKVRRLLPRFSQAITVLKASDLEAEAWGISEVRASQLLQQVLAGEGGCCRLHKRLDIKQI
jgi:hypothetical protein